MFIGQVESLTQQQINNTITIRRNKMSQWSYTKKPNWVGDGKDAYNANNVVPTTKGWEYQPTGEVLVAISSLSVKNTDVTTVPTFTAIATYSGTSAMITGDVLTVTLTSSEPVKVNGTPEIGLTIGVNTRALVFNPALSTNTSLVFDYTIVAGDTAVATGVSVAALTTGGSVYDIIDGGALIAASVTYVAPNVSTVTVN